MITVLKRITLLFFASLIALTVSLSYANIILDTFSTGTNPRAIAVNAVTNRIYTANYLSNDVTIFYGETRSTSTIPVGINPYAIAINQLTNRIYVVNKGGDNVSVIDGALETVAAVVDVGNSPYAICINPITNKIYVSNDSSNSVTKIDGITNSTTTIPVGIGPRGIAINPMTGIVYVANYRDTLISLINEKTGLTSTLRTDTFPNAIAVNPLLNRIYVTNTIAKSFSVIEGANNSINTTPAYHGVHPYNVAVNLSNNNTYVSVYFNAGGYYLLSGANGTSRGYYHEADAAAIALNPITNMMYFIGYGAYLAEVNCSDEIYPPRDYAIGSGGYNRAIAINPVSNIGYATNDSSNTVSMFEGDIGIFVERNGYSGKYPCASAYNPITKTVYFANYGSRNVTSFYGMNVTVGAGPRALAVNPVTNTIYVANDSSGSATIIDVLTGTTNEIAVGSRPSAIAVNPATNKCYIANHGSRTVSVLDGVTKLVENIPASSGPLNVAVNLVTNKIYAVCDSTNTIMVIDGEDNSTTNIMVGTMPVVSVVNPVTNKIYVVNKMGKTVTIIDGNTNSTITVPVGEMPCAAAINVITNKIFVTNYADSSVTILDGVTNQTTTIAILPHPISIAVNPVTNKIYVTNYTDSSATVIDGFSLSIRTVTGVGSHPNAVIVDPILNYALMTQDSLKFAFATSGNQSSLQPTRQTDVGLWAIADAIRSTYSFSNPTITGKGVNRMRPGRSGIWSVQLSRTNYSSFTPATITSGAGTDSVSWSWTPNPNTLLPGENFFCLMAFDSISGAHNTVGMGTPFSGNMTVCPVYYIPPKNATNARSNSGLTSDGGYQITVANNGLVRFNLPFAAGVSIRCFSLQGKQIFSLSQSMEAGYHMQRLPTSVMAYGTVILLFRIGSYQKAFKVNLSHQQYY